MLLLVFPMKSIEVNSKRHFSHFDSFGLCDPTPLSARPLLVRFDPLCDAFVCVLLPPSLSAFSLKKACVCVVQTTTRTDNSLLSNSFYVHRRAVSLCNFSWFLNTKRLDSVCGTDWLMINWLCLCFYLRSLSNNELKSRPTRLLWLLSVALLLSCLVKARSDVIKRQKFCRLGKLSLRQRLFGVAVYRSPRRRANTIFSFKVMIPPPSSLCFT